MKPRYEEIKKAVILKSYVAPNGFYNKRVLIITNKSACIITSKDNSTGTDVVPFCYKYLKIWKFKGIKLMCCPVMGDTHNSGRNKWPYKRLSKEELIKYYEYLL